MAHIYFFDRLGKFFYMLMTEGLLSTYMFVFSKLTSRSFLHKSPIIVHIEINNTCNFRCKMCPINEMKRKPEFMGFAMYKKIIDECARIGVRDVRLFMLGEPLLHPKLIEFIKYAKSAGIPHVDFNSNGSLLDRIDQKALLGSGIDEIVFSVTGATQETYGKFQNGDLAKIEAGIKSFIGLKRGMGVKKPKITMQFICSDDSKRDVAAYLKRWSPYADDINITELNDYYDPKEKANLKKKFCPHLGTTLVVLSNGTIVPCCQDYEGSLDLGDVRKTAILDAWDSKRLNECRRLHLAGKGDLIGVCKNCSEMYEKT